MNSLNCKLITLSCFFASTNSTVLLQEIITENALTDKLKSLKHSIIDHRPCKYDGFSRGCTKTCCIGDLLL